VLILLLILVRIHISLFLFVFNYTATTEIYTLSLHDALPISHGERPQDVGAEPVPAVARREEFVRRRRVQSCERIVSEPDVDHHRSEEHTSELQSHLNLVCRLLLEKKKKKYKRTIHIQAIHIQ